MRFDTGEQDYVSYIRGMVGHEPVFLCAAVSLIENEKGEILLERRGNSDKWGFPGGLAELGESLAETAVRETREELGLITEVQELIGVYTKYFAQCANEDRFQSVTALFKARITGGELCCDGIETTQAEFFKRDQLPEMYCTQHRDMLEDVLAGRRGVFR